VLDRTQTLPQKGQSPTQFLAHVYCGQTVAWIKMPLDTEVGLGLRDIAFDVDQATPRKKGTPTPPNFWPIYCGQMAGWMKMPLGTRPHCTRWGPSSRKRGTAAPLFSAHVYCGHGCPSQLLLSSSLLDLEKNSNYLVKVETPKMHLTNKFSF